jgi:thioredoxin reductase
MRNTYDVIIVGGSYSGLAAGMALGRSLRRVLIIDGGNPCNRQTPYSHNFLTQDGKAPAEIADLARQQVGRYKTVQFLSGNATEGSRTPEGFEIRTESGEGYTAPKLIFATGIRDTLPDIPGFAECWGISVLHCPYCHGYEVRNRPTGFLGNGDPGFEFALLLRNWTEDLTVFTNGPSQFTSDQAAALAARRIRMVETPIQKLVHAKGTLRSVRFLDGAEAPLAALYARVPFTQHCLIPASLGCESTPDGYLKVDSMQRTTLPGVYACGDNTSAMRTVANAVASGTTAGMMVNKEMVLEIG